jgi:hypothetical protein
MRVLVADGSKLGGTAGIAELIGSAVEEDPPAFQVAMELLSLDQLDRVHA